MIIASFYTPRPDHKFFQPYEPFLRILDESCKRFGHEHIVLTDRPLEGFKTRRTELPKNLMHACLHAQLCFLANVDEDVLLVGADCVLANDPAVVFDDPDQWGMAVTLGNFQDSILNTGAIWVRKGYGLAAALIWNEAKRVCGGEWGDDQTSLRDAMGIKDLDGVGYALESRHMRIKMLPVDPYNLAPEHPGDDCRRGVVLHFRGPRKGWQQDYCAAWLGIGEPRELKVINPDLDTMLGNMRVNCRHDLPSVTVAEPNDTPVMVCGSGPSLSDSLREIAARKAQGWKLIAINGAARYLLDRGIAVDHCLVMDPDPGCLRFVEGLDVPFLIASQVSPVVLDHLVEKKRNVTLFHLDMPGAGEIAPAGVALVGAVVCAGISAPLLLYVMGFRDIHLFGVDSSDREAAHVYETAGPERPETMEVWVRNRRFYTNGPMRAQAEAFPDVANLLIEGGAQVTVHGDGLLPAMVQAILEENAA